MTEQPPRRLYTAVTKFWPRIAVGLVTTVVAIPSPTSAQQLGPGTLPMGARMDFIDDAYPVAGTTAREILDQMRALGPGSRWIRTPYRYNWTYKNERVPLSGGALSTTCRPMDFQLVITVTATYPRWTPPTNADEQLVAAWADFSIQLERWWEQVRGDIRIRSREAARRVRV